MRLLTYKQDGTCHVGIDQPDLGVVSISDLAHAVGKIFPDDMVDLIANWNVLRPQIDAALADLAAGGLTRQRLTTLELVAPIPRPRNAIYAVGMNYVAHVDEAHHSMNTSIDLPKAPVYFTKPANAIVPPNGKILYHATVTKQLDWEAELAVIIGKGGKAISKDDALDHVFGYTCINDISARDCRREHQWFLAKSQDGSAPMGPVIVTRDEIPDPHTLNIWLKVNGETRQDGNSAKMIFKIPDIIADLSRAITLEAGDIIATGTPSGVGIAMTPPQFLQDQDRVEMAVEGIGVLANTVHRV